MSVTLPPRPDAEVDETISPPLASDVAPLVVTDTWPALPLEPDNAALEISDRRLDVLSVMLSDAALTATVPASPVPSVEDSIAPPLVTVIAPVAFTVTVPAAPLDPTLAEVDSPVATESGSPAIASEAVLSVTSPAFPEPYVCAWITPPLVRVAAPVVVTDTVPELTLDAAELEIPVKIAEGPPSALKELAVRLTFPTLPTPALVARIAPPLESVVGPVVTIERLPLWPLAPLSVTLDIPVPELNPVPTRFREAALMDTLAAAPAPCVVVEIRAPLLIVAAAPTFRLTGAP
jgi:hypothetical protein